MPHPLRIAEPRWTRPAWAAPGGTLCLALAGGAGGRAACSIRNADAVWPLEDAAPGLWRVPDDAPEGMYDLVADDGGQQAFALHSVCVRRPPKGGFAFAHVTDLHLGSLGPGNSPEPNYRAADALVEFLNARTFAFVCLTGDLISRYGPDKAPLPANLIRQAARRARGALCRLRAPVFVTKGNHDVAFPASRDAWAEFMGGPVEGPDDYAFDFAGVRFAFLDAYVHYDPATGQAVGRGQTPEQMDWLRRAMARPGARLRVLATHCDLCGHLADLAEEIPLDLILYGHSGNPKWNGAPVAERALNGHTRSHECRIVRCEGGAIESEVAEWAG